jgi:hypothetical protein
MKKINYTVVVVLLIFVCFFLFGNDVAAQCPMCKMSAESNLKNGGTMGRGLNQGILYMLAAPYVFVGALAYLWIRNRKEVIEDDKIVIDQQVFSEN